MLSICDIEKSASVFGLCVRGCFTVDEDDNVPDLSFEEPTKSLVLLGNVGSSLWPVFSRSSEYLDGESDALDRWTLRVGSALASTCSGRAFFPFSGPPYHPFIQWAKKAERLNPSVLGILIHPSYGLWHAYRLAIALPNALPDVDAFVSSAENATNICENCVDQPCLQSCPVGAFTLGHYDVQRCYGFLGSQSGGHCMDNSCSARLACPVGDTFQYQLDHAKFHMRAFLDNK